MADEPAVEEAAPADEGQRGNLLPVIIAGVVALLLGIGATVGGLYATGMLNLSGGDAAAAAEGGEGAPEAAEDGSVPASPDAAPSTEVVHLEAFKVNLKDGSSKLAIDIALEGKSVDGKVTLGSVVAEHDARIRDTVIFLLMDFTRSELSGTDGMLRARDEIHRRIDVALEGEGVQVDRVYITDTVIQ